MKTSPGRAGLIQRLAAAATVTVLGSAGLFGLPIPAQAAASLPCDIYASAGTPCVAAYSMIRALYAGYDGPLYQVQRASDGATADIGLLSAGGDVNASEQDSFCAGTTCTITELYDQSPEGNNLTIEQRAALQAPDNGADATALPITIGGYKAYGLDIEPGTGTGTTTRRGSRSTASPRACTWWPAAPTSTPAAASTSATPRPTTTTTATGTWTRSTSAPTCYFAPCTGSGPWVEADMENGLFTGGNGPNTANDGNNSDFVTAMLKNNGQTTYALKGGNAQSGGLTTWWEGALPDAGGYTPMHQEGAIVLGTGGDNSNWSVGSFFEGVMTSGYPTDAADAAVQASIVSAGYTGASGGGTPPAATISGPGGQCVDVLGDDSGTDGAQVDLWDASPRPSISTGRTTPTTRSARWAAAWTSTATARRRAPRSSCGTVTASAARIGCSRPTERCSTRSRACASTTPATIPPTAPSSRSGPATAPQLSSSR